MNRLFKFVSILFVTSVSSTSYSQQTSSAAQLQSILCQNPQNLTHVFSGPFRSPTRQNLVITTWNTKKFENEKSFVDLERISIESDIVFVQESMHSDEIEKKLIQTSDKQFSFYKSFCTDSAATGVMTATKMTQDKILNLVSKDSEPITNTPKVTGYSQIKIKNQTVHLLNTHALNFNTGSAFEKQITDVVEFIKTLEGPVIWAGDFNTWNSSRTQFLFRKTQSVGLKHLEPANDNRTLKLDHIFVRGFTAENTLIRQEDTSDHWPIETTLNLIDSKL